MCNILTTGIYTTETKKIASPSERPLLGVLTITNIIDRDKNIIGKKNHHTGKNNIHEDTSIYHFKHATSTHLAESINSSHTTEIVKANSRMFIKEGHGHSHTMNRAVEFKKVFTKSKNNNNLKIKLYIKGEDDNKYALQTTIKCKFIS